MARIRDRLVLASASPRRLQLLRQIGVEPDIVEAAEIEETPRPGERPADLALRLARVKAEAVGTRHAGLWVLGADTVVACGRRILPKPANEAEARSCLSLLSGRRHVVHGGICLIDPSAAVHTRRVETTVSFKRLHAREIAAYLETGEWQGKAGGYAIQGHAARFVRSINGSYSNVVGLPLFEVGGLLDGRGFVPAEARAPHIRQALP